MATRAIRGSFFFWTQVRRPKKMEATIRSFQKGGAFWHRVKETYIQIGKFMVRMSRQRAPEFTGALKASLNYRVRGPLEEPEMRFAADIFYAAPVEEGSRKHVTFSPRVRLWAEAKGYNPWIIYRMIRLEGTAAHPFFWPTVDDGERGLRLRLYKLLNRVVRGQ